MTEFPALVYRCPGKFPAKGCTYEHAQVLTTEELSSKIEAGWYPNLQLVIDAFLNKESTEWGIVKEKSSSPRLKKSALHPTYSTYNQNKSKAP